MSLLISYLMAQQHDTATLTINIIASQDLTARNDTGTVNEDATLDC